MCSYFYWLMQVITRERPFCIHLAQVEIQNNLSCVYKSKGQLIHEK